MVVGSRGSGHVQNRSENVTGGGAGPQKPVNLSKGWTHHKPTKLFPSLSLSDLHMPHLFMRSLSLPLSLTQEHTQPGGSSSHVGPRQTARALKD